MLTRISLSMMADLANVNGIRQELVEVPAGKTAPSSMPARSVESRLGYDAPAIEFVTQRPDGSQCLVKVEYLPDRSRFHLVDDEPLILDVIAKGRQSAHPHTLLLRSRDLVADPFRGDFALELGKRQQHVQ